MRKWKKIVLVLATLPLLASQRAVSGPNQGITIYCAGTGCSAWGTPVTDLSNDGNWTLFYRLRFDPSIGDGNHDTFAQTTLVGGAFTCAGIYLRGAKSGATWPMNVNLTVTGGISSFTIFGSSTNLTAGPVYAIELTHDSSHNWTLYFNGTSVGTFSGSETIGTGCDTFLATVAGATDCGGSEVGCWINDFALFPSVISTLDTKALASGTRPNLISTKPSVWLPMDAGQATCNTITTEPDMSGNGHAAKLGAHPAPDYCGSTGAQTNLAVGVDNGEATH